VTRSFLSRFVSTLRSVRKCSLATAPPASRCSFGHRGPVVSVSHTASSASPLKFLLLPDSASPGSAVGSRVPGVAPPYHVSLAFASSTASRMDSAMSRASDVCVQRLVAHRLLDSDVPVVRFDGEVRGVLQRRHLDRWSPPCSFPGIDTTRRRLKVGPGIRERRQFRYPTD